MKWNTKKLNRPPLDEEAKILYWKKISLLFIMIIIVTYVKLKVILLIIENIISLTKENTKANNH